MCRCQVYMSLCISLNMPANIHILYTREPKKYKSSTLVRGSYRKMAPP